MGESRVNSVSNLKNSFGILIAIGAIVGMLSGFIFQDIEVDAGLCIGASIGVLLESVLGGRNNKKQGKIK
ncbi:hypothetical protein [Clostridium sardiniense]|uniref:hypothetical protein n=1 Tax=Clostridium sardiniense TaxID=29369 RepID=UPI003D32621A